MSLEKKKKRIDSAVLKQIELLGDKSPLRDASAYAATSGGKRLRPLLTLIVAEGVNKGFDALYAALAVEFFHTSSLIADDLPCMDNDDLRRGKPTLHRAFDETTALLASFSFVSLAYEMINQNAKKLKNLPDILDRIFFVFDLVNRCSGYQGAIGGQFKDVFEKEMDLTKYYEIIYQKTTTLFEAAFLLGWVFGGGDMEKVDQVKKCAFHFGKMFQIADDLGDVKQDVANKSSMNIALLLDENQAKALMQEELLEFQKCMKELRLYTDDIKEILEIVKKAGK